MSVLPRIMSAKDTITAFDCPFALSMGPQRAGTSWLDRYLRARGDVCMPSGVKEVFYFDRHSHRGEGFYRSHFDVRPEHALAMEISTTSFDSVDAPRHVHAMFGEDVKLLCPLRDPIVRSYSLYLHYKRYGIVRGHLQSACQDFPQIIQSSRYTDHLARWADIFGSDAVCILYQEDLEDDSDAYIRKVCSILDLPYMPVPTQAKGRYNATTRAPIPALAKLAQYGADALRKHKMYGVINAAKAVGLKPLIFGAGSQGGQDDVDESRLNDLAWLRAQLSAEKNWYDAQRGA